MRLSPLDLLKWIHFILLATAIGGAVVSLLLSGFEQEREDLKGLAASVWKQAVVWPVRLAILVGILTMVQKMQWKMNPFAFIYFHIKLGLVLPLAASVEMAPKALAVGKRGASMVALFLFLIISFVVYNQRLFGTRAPKVLDQPAVAAAPTK
ncbi:MAG TPA: hypothetical protein VJ505_14370 [Holophagaceae bacterium]|nr:hypothetical protein [Holophagaceae bacterium]